MSKSPADPPKQFWVWDPTDRIARKVELYDQIVLYTVRWTDPLGRSQFMDKLREQQLFDSMEACIEDKIKSERENITRNSIRINKECK